MLRSLLYVSRSLLSDDEASRALGDIVDAGRARNVALCVTGALLYSGRHFAQLLEGADTDIEELMRSINADPRHADVLVVRDIPVEEREFRDWALAYSGRSSFIVGHIGPLLDRGLSNGNRMTKDHVAALIRLMKEFVRNR